jgi:acetoin utilization protein AcuB
MEIEMRVQDVMTAGVQTISPTATADDAWTMMAIKGVHHLVVKDAARVVGVISANDLGGKRGARMRQNRLVADLMTAGVVTMQPTATVRQAANLMRGRSVGCLVVATGDSVVGIVTISDLLELIGRGLDRGVATNKRWTLKHRVPHRKAIRPVGTW